ncbi:MAG: dihydrofolate reductase family protein [Gemmatimonadota bacterium]|nr:dihydrofolate reductase family protein [Gemmatimonadota bacterium]
MRKIIAYLATSADGFIARPDGGVDWLDRPRPPGNYGMGAFLRSVDTVVMGRTTFDIGVKFGQGVWPGKRTIVLSRTMPIDSVEGAVIESGDVGKLAERLRAEDGKDIWVMGGNAVFSAFLDAGALDELIIHVVPVLIGTGIPLLDAKARTNELELKSTRKFSDGVVRLHYVVKRA